MTRDWNRLAAACLAVWVTQACSAKPYGATEPQLRLAHARAGEGAAVYERDCGPCHGPRGEGLGGVPPIMGEGSLPIHEWDSPVRRRYPDEREARAVSERSMAAGPTRGAFRNAGDVHAFLVRHMPKVRQSDAPPSPEEYWQVTSYLLVAKGIDVPPGGVDASNAGRIRLGP